MRIICPTDYHIVISDAILDANYMTHRGLYLYEAFRQSLGKYMVYYIQDRLLHGEVI
jgi:hypothetical protein